MIIAPLDCLSFFRGPTLISPRNSVPDSLSRVRTRKLCRAVLITSSDSFEVGRMIGSYGFMNVTSYSGIPPSMDAIISAPDVGRLRAQDVGEGSVKIRLYEGRISKGPYQRTPVILKVYPGMRGSGSEADMMAANEINTHMFLQDTSDSLDGFCQNLSVLIGGFETTTGEKWLAFRDHGKFSAADYAKSASKKVAGPAEKSAWWSQTEIEYRFKRKRKFVTRLFQCAMTGLAYMHRFDRLHQSLGPSSIVLNTTAEREVDYLIPRLRDFAFSADVRYSSLEEGPGSPLSDGLWRRAASSSAYTSMDKRAFGIADDIYEAGLLLAYLAFVPFCEEGSVDSLSLQRLLENTFSYDMEAIREYCLADDRLLDAVKYLDSGDGAGWELLKEMLNPDYQRRPIAEAVLNHRFIREASVRV